MLRDILRKHICYGDILLLCDWNPTPRSACMLNNAKWKRNLIECPKQVVLLLLQKSPPSRGQEAHFDWQRGYSQSISAFKKTRMWKVSDLQARRGWCCKEYQYRKPGWAALQPPWPWPLHRSETSHVPPATDNPSKCTNVFTLVFPSSAIL